MTTLTSDELLAACNEVLPGEWAIETTPPHGAVLCPEGARLSVRPCPWVAGRWRAGVSYGWPDVDGNSYLEAGSLYVSADTPRDALQRVVKDAWRVFVLWSSALGYTLVPTARAEAMERERAAIEVIREAARRADLCCFAEDGFGPLLRGIETALDSLTPKPEEPTP